MVKRSVYSFDQYFFNLSLDNSHQYILDCISILDTFILNTGTLGLSKPVFVLLEARQQPPIYTGLLQLGAFILNAETLSFEQAMSTFWGGFRGLSPSSASRTARLPRWRRVTRAEASPRARGRRGPQADVVSRGTQAGLK